MAALLPACVLKVLKVHRVESVCIEEDTLIFEVNLVEDNDMLDDDDDVDKRARTPRQPPPLPAKTGSIRNFDLVFENSNLMFLLFCFRLLLLKIASPFPCTP